MAQVHKAPVAEMHDIWSTNLSLVSSICPDLIHSVDVVEGEMGSEGCVIACKFNHLGKLLVVKEMMEVVDKENYRIVAKIVEGGPLELYKSFKWTCQGSPVDNVVRWTLEYEMDGDNVPKPDVIDRIDAHLTRA